jgi:hypothetical protein
MQDMKPQESDPRGSLESGALGASLGTLKPSAQGPGCSLANAPGGHNFFRIQEGHQWQGPGCPKKGVQVFAKTSRPKEA